MNDTDKTFLETADSRDTDAKIMAAILSVAGNDEVRAVRVWEDPTDAEMTAIWEIVTNNGLRPATDYCWGWAGSKWANGIGT